MALGRAYAAAFGLGNQGQLDLALKGPQVPAKFPNPLPRSCILHGHDWPREAIICALHILSITLIAISTFKQIRAN